MTGVSFSVVMPLYNKEKFVSESIESVLKQTLSDWELIIVDDGSTDESVRVVSTFNDSRIRLLRQKNGGVSVARNSGIANASGQYVCFLDADDVYEINYLHEIWQLVAQFPKCDVFCSGYTRFWEDGKSLVSLRNGQTEGQAAEVEDFYQDWRRSSFTCTIAISVRRSVLTAMQPCFPIGERLGEDQDLWFRLAEHRSIAHINQALVRYRMDAPGSLTKSPNAIHTLPCYERLWARIDHRTMPNHLVPSARKLFSSHLLNVANDQITDGDYSGAATTLLDYRSRANVGYWVRTGIRFLRGRYF